MMVAISTQILKDGTGIKEFNIESDRIHIKKTVYDSNIGNWRYYHKTIENRNSIKNGLIQLIDALEYEENYHKNIDYVEVLL